MFCLITFFSKPNFCCKANKDPLVRKKELIFYINKKLKMLRFEVSVQLERFSVKANSNINSI